MTTIDTVSMETAMLDKLDHVLKHLPDLLGDVSRWDSLIVNARKPHTYRAFTDFAGVRVCTHRFELCDEEDAFRHPHGWKGAFAVMGGYYRQKIWYALDRYSEPHPDRIVIDMVLGPGSTYAIENPLTWHSVQPTEGYDGAQEVFCKLPESVWSVMVNDAPWDAQVAHAQTVTTKGKDLDKLTPEEMVDHLQAFQFLWEGLLCP